MMKSFTECKFRQYKLGVQALWWFGVKPAAMLEANGNQEELHGFLICISNFYIVYITVSSNSLSNAWFYRALGAHYHL